MDPSALIFVALAVAWAVYLVPKALKHHDEAVRSRSVEKFSHTMRVLARREPVDRRNARLVVAPTRAARRPSVETKGRTTPATTPDPTRAPLTREATRRAARRRRNVLATILVGNSLTLVLAATSVIGWLWMVLPVTLLLAWLVACRVSVKAERATRGCSVVRTAARDAIEIGEPVADPDATDVDLPAVPAQPAPVPAAEAPAVLTGEIPLVPSTPGGWDMVPTTLPTYVTKPAAQRRSVRTIDLESTGVWSSGHSESDSALAREAEASEKSSVEAEAAAAARRVAGA